jgi:hypothetical protein
VVTLDQDLVISTLEIVSPLFRCLNNRQELLIVRVIGLFGGAAFSIVNIDWVKDPKSVVLIEDARECEAAHIGLQNDQFLPVDMLEDRCFGKGRFELSQWEFGIPSPFRLP